MREARIKIWRPIALVGACVVWLPPACARASELSFGASVGGIQIGPDPKLAAGAFGALGWRTENGLLVEVHNMFSFIVGSRVGIHDRTSATIGYAWRTGDLKLGPSLSIYSMMACGPVVCRRVEGAAPGGHVQADWYFLGPLGVSLSINVAWYGGHSSVLPDNTAAMISAGPIVQLEGK